MKIGNLYYPFFAKTGLVLAAILTFAYFLHHQNRPIHLSLALILAIGFVLIFTVLPALALALQWILKFHTYLETKTGTIKLYGLIIAILVIYIAVILLLIPSPTQFVQILSGTTRTTEPVQTVTTKTLLVHNPPVVTPGPLGTSAPTRIVNILVDDFSPQPYQGDTVYFNNRLEGDRGALNNSIVDWGIGQVTATISKGNSWGGIWMSLNHPIRENLPINFSAVLPSAILSAYQSKVIGITAQIAGGTPGKTFRVELKNGNTLSWKNETQLLGGHQNVSADLPALQNISQLVLVLDHASPGDFIVLDNISLIASKPVMDTATEAFVWSYGMLLNNWNPSSGLVRDKAKDASGEFDAIQATGSLAAATALAEQDGVVNRADAVAIVNKISDTLLNRLPRNHGLWPHWVRFSPGGNIDIVPSTEWSSVDSVIAAISLLEAQSGLGLDTSVTEQMLTSIDWDNLVTDKGISHGYSYSNETIPYAWDTFGGESWLVELAYAAANGNIATLTHPSPPTANGAGFIDELAWLYVPPPLKKDHWGTDWPTYRIESAEKQNQYYTDGNSNPCFSKIGLYGLSAGEVPAPAWVPITSLYQAFGLGGQFGSLNDGSELMGAPVVLSHYSAMTASLQPEEAIQMWDWLITFGHFSPLNNVESLMFPANSNCQPDSMEWNQLKGSWNLALQTLGWGRYLAERDGQIPILWQATKTNKFLQEGYLLLAPNGPSNTPSKLIAVYITQPNETPVIPIYV